MRPGQEFLGKLEDIDRKGLSPSKRVDWGVLRNAFRLWIFQSEEIGIWKSKPAASDPVGDSLFPLFMRSVAPLAKRLASITGRLARSPAYIEDTKDRIRTPVRMWSEIALESTERLPGFLNVIEATGKENLTGPERARLEEAVAKTEEALRRHARWIKEDVLPRSKDTIGIGAAKFRKLVGLRELGLTVEEIYAIGKRYLRESRRTLVRLANEIKPGASVEEASEIVKSDHPSRFEGALEYTAKAKFVQMTDQIWRACRIIIDVDLHTGKMGFDEVVDFLVRESGMERPGAIAEVKRYTYWPAYQLSYLLGKHLIVQLRKDVKRG